MKKTIALLVMNLSLLPSLPGMAQEDAALIGLGGAAGVSLTTNGGVSTTYQLTVFLDRPLRTSSRFVRLQGDLGTWSAERKTDDGLGNQESRWHLYHLSASAQTLLGSDALIVTLGLGTTLFLIHETETTHYTAEEEKNEYSSLSFGLFPVAGMILPLSDTTEFTLNVRYDFVMHPTNASRLAIMTGFCFLLQ